MSENSNNNNPDENVELSEHKTDSEQDMNYNGVDNVNLKNKAM